METFWNSVINKINLNFNSSSFKDLCLFSSTFQALNSYVWNASTFKYFQGVPCVYASQCMCYQNIDRVSKHHWLIHTDWTGLDKFEFRRPNRQFCNGSRLMNCWNFNISPTGRVSRYSGIKKIWISYQYETNSSSESFCLQCNTLYMKACFYKMEHTIHIHSLATLLGTPC